MTRFVAPLDNQFDINGNPLVGAKREFFVVGEVTLKDTFSDEALTTPNTNPVIANASGVFPDIFLKGDVDTTLSTAGDVLISGPLTVREFASVSDGDFIKNFLTLAAAVADAANLPIGQTIFLEERTTGDGGGGHWSVIASTTNNTFNIVDTPLNTAISLKVIENGPVDLKRWGAGLGVADDRAIFQSAITQGFINFLNSDGTYLIGDSGNTIVYRATTTKVGVALPSNVVMLFSGHNSIVKVVDSSDCVPFTADAKSNITFGDYRLEGNAVNQPGSLLFGMYCLNCTNVNQVGTVWTNETKDNTIEIIGCTDVDFNNTINNTSTAGSSIGGGPQFEDCTNVTLGRTTGNTFDDLVSVIAHGGNVEDHSLGFISGECDNARALFIGQSNSAASQRTIKGITADINCHDCGVVGVTAAFVIGRGGLFSDINVSIVDRDSFRSVQIAPFDATFHGTMKNVNIDLVSTGSKVRAVNIIHDDDVLTVMENCSIKALINNPNASDSATENDGFRLEAGEWEVDVDLTYPPGKTNVGQGMVLGGSTGVNDILKNTNVRGRIKGGNKNIQMNFTDDVSLDMILLDSEDANNISLDITVNSKNTKLNNIVRDGEIQDDSAAATQTQRSITQLSRNSASTDTGASTSEVDLMTYTLPADWMGKTGVLHIKASGLISGANDNKTLTFKFGGTSHVLHAAANDTGDWSTDIYIYQQGARNSQRLDINHLFGTVIAINDGVSDGESTTSAVVIKFTGQTVNSGDLVQQRTMSIEGS